MRSGRPQLFATRVNLLLALAAATIALNRLHSVGDRPISVSVVPVAASDNCVKRCNEPFIKAIQAESTHHKEVVKNVCGGNFVCHRDENYRHQVALQKIMAEHKACTNGCPGQVTSTAGF
jgi:hypothetical protein